METILDSEVLSKYISRKSLESYERDLDKWVSDFVMERYIGRADHFGIKVEDEMAQQEVVRAIKPYCVAQKGDTPGLSVRTMHGRKIAVALLKNPIPFKKDLIDCIEIMQPRPEKVRDYEILGIDHLEVICSNLDALEEDLMQKSAEYYIDETNPYKEIVVSFINGKKERIKFTNKTLEEIVPMQIRDAPELVETIPTT